MPSVLCNAKLIPVERYLGRKIIKLLNDAEISRIERQNTKSWEPAKFFTETELKTAIDAVLAAASPNLLSPSKKSLNHPPSCETS